MTATTATTKTMTALSLVAAAALAMGCGGSTPPPKTEEAPKEESHGPSGPQLVVEQEFGSIDERAVEGTFARLETGLEKCHTEGRDRVEYLAGDVKVYLRIGKDGRVKWQWFEESTLGDRETEKCILDLFARTDWPKPIGGDAEVRHGFGWGPGGERQPVPYGPEKVLGALDADREVKSSVKKCKAGVKSDFTVTAYVENDDSPPAEAPKKKPKGKPKSEAAREKTAAKLRAIGVAAPSKEGAAKVDCIVDALKDLRVPTPGSYAGKTTFPL